MIFYLSFNIPIIMLITAGLASLTLNIILWYRMHKYYSKYSSSIKSNGGATTVTQTASFNNINEARLIPSSSTCSAMNSGTLMSSISSRTRANHPRNSYHFVLIMTSLTDLPYYLYSIYELYLVNFNWTRFISETNWDFTYFLQVLFLLGHSVNFIIFYFFHKEFHAISKRILLG